MRPAKIVTIAFNKASIARIVLMAITLTFAACGSQQTVTQNSDDLTPITEQTVAQLINQAQQLPEPERTDQLLVGAQQLYTLKEYDWARNTLNTVDASIATDMQWLSYSLLSADIAMAQGNPFKAKHYLWNERFVSLIDQATSDLQTIAYDKRATLLFDISEYSQSVDERVKLGELLNTQDNLDMVMLNQDLLWQALMVLPTSELELQATSHPNETARGWYALASISKNNQNNLQQQLRGVNNWMGSWPAHPASKILPGDLQLLQQLVESQPNNIAVLLPLSGKLREASQTILDGFMAAHYQTQSNGQKTPTIRVYDTMQSPINTVYDLAVKEGAEFIIGPLDKKNIRDLYLRGFLPIPTLALNYINTENVTLSAQQSDLIQTDDTTMQNPFDSIIDEPASETEQPLAGNTETSQINSSLTELADAQVDIQNAPLANDTSLRGNLYQFGLALEDEAQQVALKAFVDGHRRALIIAPKTEFGQRGSSRFISEWLELGGEIVDLAEFSTQKEYSSLVEAATGVKASKQRANDVQRLIGNTEGFEPRRRQDIDMIFLLARPSQARQIKPTLNFHYSSDIPVYATSHIYNGQLNGALDRDMNGIHFTTLPWFFDLTLSEKKLITNYGLQQQGSPYYSLYAFGVDSYHLYPRLRQLKEVQQARFYGSTGSLNIAEDQRVTREQIWAKFVNGQALQISSTNSSADPE